MTNLSKLTVKSVVRTSKQDPVAQRRQKLMAGIEEQMKVAAAAMKGESFEKLNKTWVIPRSENSDSFGIHRALFF